MKTRFRILNSSGFTDEEFDDFAKVGWKRVKNKHENHVEILINKEIKLNVGENVDNGVYGEIMRVEYKMYYIEEDVMEYDLKIE